MNTTNTRFSYMIFSTPMGKGYGCFAIRHTKGDDTYEVSCAFCHPNDRAVFSKPEARHKAYNRLNSNQWVTEVKSENNNYAEIIRKAVLASNKAPSWAIKAIKNGVASHTLKQDHLDSNSIKTIVK